MGFLARAGGERQQPVGVPLRDHGRDPVDGVVDDQAGLAVQRAGTGMLDFPQLLNTSLMQHGSAETQFYNVVNLL